MIVLEIVVIALGAVVMVLGVRAAAQGPLVTTPFARPAERPPATTAGSADRGRTAPGRGVTGS